MSGFLVVGAFLETFCFLVELSLDSESGISMGTVVRLRFWGAAGLDALSTSAGAGFSHPAKEFCFGGIMDFR